MKHLAVLFVLLSTAAFATDVTTCGQVVAPGDVGILQADLDCSGVSGPLLAAVLLQENASLSLNGHTLIGRADEPGVVSDVARRCTVSGPGTITGASTGIYVGMTRLTVHDLVLQQNNLAIDASVGRLDVRNVTADSSVSGGRIRADHLTVTRDGDGNCIMGGQLRGSDITVTGCHTGVTAGVVRVTRLDASDNFTIGVTAKKVKLTDSVVTGNIFIGHPLDILTDSMPKLVNTTCGTSAQRDDSPTGVGPTWGVCAND
jgi:hypothetical protein